VGIRINQNIMALNSYRNLTTSEGQLSKSLEKLSSGFRINKAADDASGLVISEGLRSQVMGLKMAIRNTQDGISVVQTAEGALTEVHSLLQRIRELAVQAASTGSSDPASRDAAQAEVSQLLEEVDRISTTTRFGGQQLLDGTYGVTQAQHVGANTANQAAFAIAAATDTFTINVGNGARIVTLTQGAAGTFSAASLETNINNAVNGALALAGDDPDLVDFDVELVAVVGTPFRVTLNGADGATVTIAENGETGLANLGLTPGAYAPTGSGGVFQVGASSGETIDFAISDTATDALGTTLNGISDVDVAADADQAITDIDEAIEEISVLRGNLGALQNRFEHTINNLSVTMENLSASESRIRDTDMAAEMMQFTRAQILQQAGTAMLAQANALPQSVLQLLQ
jgi:flagellin